MPVPHRLAASLNCIGQNVHMQFIQTANDEWASFFWWYSRPKLWPLYRVYEWFVASFSRMLGGCVNFPVFSINSFVKSKRRTILFSSIFNGQFSLILVACCQITAAAAYFSSTSTAARLFHSYTFIVLDAPRSIYPIHPECVPVWFFVSRASPYVCFAVTSSISHFCNLATQAHSSTEHQIQTEWKTHTLFFWLHFS